MCRELAFRHAAFNAHGRNKSGNLFIGLNGLLPIALRIGSLLVVEGTSELLAQVGRGFLHPTRDESDVGEELVVPTDYGCVKPRQF